MTKEIHLGNDAQSDALWRWAEDALAFTEAEEAQEAVEEVRWWASLSDQQRAEIDAVFLQKFGKTYRECIDSPVLGEE